MSSAPTMLGCLHLGGLRLKETCQGIGVGRDGRRTRLQKAGAT